MMKAMIIDDEPLARGCDKSIRGIVYRSTAEGSFLKNKTMAFFEKSLPADRFARTHRSYIINEN